MKKFWKSAWGVSIGTTLLGFMLSLLKDCLSKKPVFSTIAAVVTTIVENIIFVLNLNLKLWWVLLALVILFGLYICYAYIKTNIDFTEEKPRFLSYTEDIIDSWHIKWSWKRNYNGEYYMDDIHPICTRCGTPLFCEMFEPIYCPRCKQYYRKNFPDEQHFEIIIKDNVEKENFSASNCNG